MPQSETQQTDQYGAPSAAEIGTEWYHRAYRAFREWLSEDPPDEFEAVDTADQSLDPDNVESGEHVVSVDAGSVGLPAAVVGEESADSWPAPVADPKEAKSGASSDSSSRNVEDAGQNEPMAEPEPIAQPSPMTTGARIQPIEADQALIEAVPQTADVAAGHVAPESDPAVAQESGPEAAGHFVEVGVEDDPPMTTQPESAPEQIAVSAPASDADEIQPEMTEVDSPTGGAGLLAGIHAGSEQVVDPELLLPQTNEDRPHLIEAISPELNEDPPPLGAVQVVGVAETDPTFAEEVSRLEAAGLIAEAGQPATPEGEDAPELLVRQEIEAESGKVEAEPVAQTAGERQVENVENPPQEGQLMSDPLIRAASKLTDPVNIGAANVPVGGLTRRDETSGTDRQSLSAEGADGTSSTLNSNDGDGRGYEAPSTWDEIVQRVSFDTDADDDGIPDNMQDSDGDGLSNYHERWVYDTDPNNADTDGDGVKDGAELRAGSDPTVPDGSGDTDDDGIPDRTELLWGYDPANPDMDDDGLKDGFEVKYGTDPTIANTDGKGPDDGQEDVDLDGLTAVEEQARGTRPDRAYSNKVNHDKTGLTLDEAEGQLLAGREDIRRTQAEEEAAEIAAGPRYRVVTEGDAEYVFEGSNFFATLRIGAGTGHVTDVKTGESIPVTAVPRGAAIRLANDEDIAELKENLHLIEDGREELPKDDRSPLQRMIDYRDGVKLEPPEKAPPAGEFERGGFDGDGEGETEPDSVDIDGMTLEREVPVVDGARVDPSSLLAGDLGQDPAQGSTVGTDPFGAGSSTPAEDDRSPVGKAVDPEDVAAQVAARIPGDDRNSPGQESTTGDAFSEMPDPLDDATDMTDSFGPEGGDPVGSGTGSNDGEGEGDTDGWTQGKVTGIDSEMTVDEGPGWKSGIIDWGTNDDMAVGYGDAVDGDDSSEDDDSADGEGAESGGGETGGDDSPNFGGGMDVDRGALLDSIGRREQSASMGTDMRATPGPREQGIVRESTPVARMPVQVDDGYDAETADADEDGVTDAQERRDGTDIYDPESFLDSDGDGIPDAQDTYDNSEKDVEDSSGDTSEDDETDEADGVSTTADPLGGGIIDRTQAEEALKGVGAPQNGAQPQPIDPIPWEDTIEERAIVGEIISSDALAQPVPDAGGGVGRDREIPTTDAGATGGIFGTNVIDPSPDTDTAPQGEGPWEDMPNIIDVDAARESESTREAPLQEVELGTALQATSATPPGPPSGEQNYLGDPVGAASSSAGSSSTSDDATASGAGPQRVGSDPAAGIDDNFVGRLEMSLATTGPNDTPLTARDDESDSDSNEGFGTGDSGPPAEPDTTSDESFGTGGSDDGSDTAQEVSSPVIATADELGGFTPDKAEALGIFQDEPLVELVSEVTKTDIAPKDESPADAEDLAVVGQVDALETWDA